MSEMRDIARDREMWAATTPGRWGWARADRTSGLPPIIHVLVDTSYGPVPIGEQIAIVGEPGMTYGLDARVYDNARFICEAHEAFPYYLDRCEKLEAALEKAISVLYVKCEVCPKRENCTSSSECHDHWYSCLLKEANNRA